MKFLMKKCVSLGLAGSLFSTFVAMADCLPQDIRVRLATPLSSRIDRVGDTVQAVLEKPLSLNETITLPAGTLLMGRITSLQAARQKSLGKIRFQLTRTNGAGLGVTAIPATTDGWLSQTDAGGAVWQVSPTRSTRLLNEKIERRLGSNRAVWAQIIGLNENTIPDVTTNEFIQSYHRHEVLVGVGDEILMHFTCPTDPAK